MADIDSFVKGSAQELLEAANFGTITSNGKDGKTSTNEGDKAMMQAIVSDDDIMSVKSDDEATTDEDEDAYCARLATGLDLREKLRVKRGQRRSVKPRTK